MNDGKDEDDNEKNEERDVNKGKNNKILVIERMRMKIRGTR